jgi:acetyl esterase/lipase
VLRVCQLVFDWPVYFTVWLWDCFAHVSHDGFECSAGIALSTFHLAPDTGTSMTIMTPSPAQQRQKQARSGSRGTIFYVHGGGFCCTRAFLYKQSMGFLVRAGFTVVCVDFPLSPQACFPVPQLAVLACIRHHVLLHQACSGIDGDATGAVHL